MDSKYFNKGKKRFILAYSQLIASIVLNSKPVCCQIFARLRDFVESIFRAEKPSAVRWALAVTWRPAFKCL